MGERVFFNNQAKIFHARRDSLLRWHCLLEVSDTLPDEVDQETVKFLLDAEDHDIVDHLRKEYFISPAQSQEIVRQAMAVAQAEEDRIRRAFPE